MSSDSELTSLSDIEEINGSPQRQQRSTVRRKASLTHDSPKSPKVTRTYSRKGRYAAGSASPMSPLTPSTPQSRRTVEDSPRKRTVPSTSTASPSKRQRVASRSNDYETSPTRKPPTSRKNGAREALSLFERIEPLSPSILSSARSHAAKEKAWSLDTLGSLVWIKVNSEGDVVPARDGSKGVYWWPAKILNDDLPAVSIEARLFNPPKFFRSDHVVIRSPSRLNIQSRLNGKGQARYSRDDFIESTARSNISSHSAMDVGISESWNVALQLMNHEDLESNDGLPSTLSALLSGEILNNSEQEDTMRKAPKKTPKSKGKRMGPNTQQEPVVDENWSPPGPDPLLEIPGERVLAREKRNKTEYWPARILSYIPPMKPTEQPRYHVQYLDNFEYDITRDMLLTSEQDGFATCKLGRFQSVKKETEDDQDTDEQIQRQSPSPEPQNPPPSLSQFLDLSLQEQFCYVKPILQLILNDMYEPAKARHEAFMKGGQKRLAICKMAGATGDLTAKTVEELSHYLTRWVLRDEAVASGELAQIAIFGEQASSKSDSDIPSMSNATALENLVDDNSKQAVRLLTPDDLEPPPSSFLTISDVRTDLKCPTSDDAAVDVARTNIQSNYTDSGIDTVAKAQKVRQKGCPAYEALSLTERLEYCANVLLPEAMIQLHLWRSGQRTSVEVLPSEEEERLHNLGQQKVDEIDWVNSIVQLRRIKEKEMEKHLKAEAVQTGTRSRPKFIA